MADTYSPPEGLVVGDSWWQKLLSYGVSRAVDAEYLTPFYPAQDTQYGVDSQGNPYRLGEPAGVGAALASNPALLVAGVVLAGTFLYLLMRD